MVYFSFKLNLRLQNCNSWKKETTQMLILWSPRAWRKENIQMYSGVRLRWNAYNKSLCKWGHFEKAKTTFKMLLATWFLVCFFKRFRSFVAKNLGSVGQRAAKLLAVKVGGLKKGLPAGPGPSQPVCPGSNPCAFKSFSKFDGW